MRRRSRKRRGRDGVGGEIETYWGEIMRRGLFRSVEAHMLAIRKKKMTTKKALPSATTCYVAKLIIKS